MKRKYYLIDTENVGDQWFGLMDKMKKKDRMVAFYTENHSKRLEEFLLRQVNNPHMIWLECAIGNNALDYQLLGVLAYLIIKHPKASFCIFSNDKGYQKTVDFWLSRGVRICQKYPNQKKKKKDKKKMKQAQKGQNAETKQQDRQKKAVPASGTKKKTETLTEKQYVSKIAGFVPVSDLNGWYCSLTVILGQQAGREWYQKFRQDIQMQNKLAKYCVSDAYTRGVGLVALALQAHGLDTSKAEKAYKIIQAHDRQDLNGIKMDMDKITEPKGQNAYYKTLRPLIPLLKNM